jgi:hypothetical protein
LLRWSLEVWLRRPTMSYKARDQTVSSACKLVRLSRMRSPHGIRRTGKKLRGESSTCWLSWVARAFRGAD